jgi:uncharacterized tellurite resistance protein B-like protein
MNKERTDLFQALAELAYAIAMADGTIQSEEKRKFRSIIRHELKEDAWIAESRFEILNSAISPGLTKSYDKAIKIIRHRRDYFDDEMQQTFLTVIQKVADSFQGEHESEADIIKNLKADIEKIRA